jgi:predicted ATPase
MLGLEGLQPTDLNTMISDALCVFPRISEPLSDIVFQKTKGNPFFVLAFLRSLVERGLLNYNINLRRWLWDEDDVSAMDVTGNVLHLLSFKMTGLSTSIQSTLKTAACFGIKIDQGVVALLGIDPEYADIQDMMEQVVKEGFMVKVGTSHFRFVHDKVQEAAYSLIPHKDKNQVSMHGGD